MFPALTQGADSVEVGLLGADAGAAPGQADNLGSVQPGEHGWTEP